MLGRIVTLEETHRLRGLKSNAVQDYLAARVLFLNGRLLQASILSSQSIEKFLKMILEMKRLPINSTHNIFSLFSYLKKNSSSQKEDVLFSKFNSEFLMVLSKLYSFRYLGDCKPGDNYVILKNKFLSEVDRLFHILYPFITLITINDPQEMKKYQNERGEFFDIDSLSLTPIKNGMISQNNFIYLNKSRGEFLNQEEEVTEFRITKGFKHIELTYTIDKSFDDEKYNYVGLGALGGLEKKALFRKDGTLVD